VPSSVRVTAANSQLSQFLPWLFATTSPFLDFQWALGCSFVWQQPSEFSSPALTVRAASLPLARRTQNPLPELPSTLAPVSWVLPPSPGSSSGVTAFEVDTLPRRSLSLWWEALLSHLFLKPCESHTLEHPVLSPSERFGCHFLQLLVVPAVNYYCLLPLARLLRASGPFSLRPNSRVRPPRLGLVSETTLHFLFATPHRVAKAWTFFRLPSVLRRLAEWSTHAVPFRLHRHLRLGQFYRSWLTASSGLTQPHSSFVTVRWHGIHIFNSKIEAA